jgi:Right handed beta helix region
VGAVRLIIFVSLIAFGFALPAQASIHGNPAAPIVPAFYVSTTGNDSNAGTLASPFATLAAAQTAMQNSGTVKTTYVLAGSYTLPALLNLVTADAGETWSYYPPDGYDNASISGGSTASGNGLNIMIQVGANNVTFNGLTLHNFSYAGIYGSGKSGLVIENCIFYNQYYVSAGSNPGGFTCYGCSSTIISHNVFYNMAAGAIEAVENNGGISNLLVTGNVVYNTCTGLADCGAIYIQDLLATSTNLQETNNFVRDGNTFAAPGTGYGSALYADDCGSNLTASGNILAGKNGSNTILIHGGNNDHFINNILDLDGFASNILTLQTSSGSGCSAGAMSGNQFENNIVIGEDSSHGYVLQSGSPTNPPTITTNDYWNYDGGTIITGGTYSDANPINQNPLLSGWTYAMNPASAVTGPPVSFPAIVGGWGPPGYAIPQTGTAPSSPH